MTGMGFSLGDRVNEATGRGATGLQGVHLPEQVCGGAFLPSLYFTD